jgi:chemotaxis protein CheD
MADIEVKMGHLEVTKSGDRLLTTGVGSCLVITLFDPVNKIGGLAHAVIARDQTCLSHSPAFSEGEKGSDPKYVDDAIDEMLKIMEGWGSKREDLKAKLIGAANIFSVIELDVGRRSIIVAKEKLKEEGIHLAGEVVGGSMGRSVEFLSSTGIVTVKIKF